MEGILSGSDAWPQVAMPELANWFQHPANIAVVCHPVHHVC